MMCNMKRRSFYNYTHNGSPYQFGQKSSAETTVKLEEFSSMSEIDVSNSFDHTAGLFTVLFQLSRRRRR